MRSLDKTSRKNFPWIILLATIAAIGLVMVFQDPLSYLRDFLARDNFLISCVVYTIVLAVSVVVSRFSIAPAVPFVAKILSPEITFVLTILGWTLGSCAAFGMARLGKETIISRVYPIQSVTQNQYRLHNAPTFITLLQTRLFAALDNLSYFIGLKTNISFVRFVLVTLVGSIPGAFLFSFSAEAIADGDKLTLFGLFFATALIVFSYVSHKGWALFERPSHVYTRTMEYNAGEIMSVAALIIFFENRNKPFKIHRSKNIDKVITKRAASRKKKEVYICDASKALDDQHNIFGSVEGGVRGNNIAYGVFGSTWKKFGTAICGSDGIAQKIEQEVVLGVDAEESGVKHEEVSELYIDQWSLSEILEKTYKEKNSGVISTEADYQKFMEAVYFAQEFLQRVISKHKASQVEQEAKE